MTLSANEIGKVTSQCGNAVTQCACHMLGGGGCSWGWALVEMGFGFPTWKQKGLNCSTAGIEDKKREQRRNMQ